MKRVAFPENVHLPYCISETFQYNALPLCSFKYFSSSSSSSRLFLWSFSFLIWSLSFFRCASYSFSALSVSLVTKRVKVSD